MEFLLVPANVCVNTIVNEENNMATKFQAGNNAVSTSIVSRKTVSVLCQFKLPEQQKDQTPLQEAQKIEGQHLISLYLDPFPGMKLGWMGHQWQIDEILVHAVSRKSREPKYVPICYTRYVEPLPVGVFGKTA